MNHLPHAFCRAVLISALALAMCSMYAIAQPEESTDVASDSPWTISFKERFQSRDYQYGVDMSGSAATLGTSASVEHDVGLEGGVGFSHLLGGVGGLQRWFVSGAYTRDFSDHYSADVEFTHYGYPDDSLNILAGLANELAFSVNGTFSPILAALTYSHYFGDNAADFLVASIFGVSRGTSWTYMAGASATFMSEQVPVNLLKTKKDKKGVIGAIPTQLVSGFSNANITFLAIRKLGHGFSVSISPTISYAPKQDVIANALNLTVAIGVTYTVSP